MLLKITKSCTMGCIHCMNDACKSNKHMSEEVLEKALDLYLETDNFNTLVVSGGEPTEHPNFMKMMHIIYYRLGCLHRNVCVTTNGMWFDRNVNMLRMMLQESEYFGVNTLVQVTNDRGYYLEHLSRCSEIFDFPNVELSDVSHLYPQGRALTNNLECTAKTRKCHNFRECVRGTSSIVEAINMYSSLNRFCSPAVCYDGSIVLGESDLCTPVASIYDTKDEIRRNILVHDCYKCDKVVRDLGGIIIHR